MSAKNKTAVRKAPVEEEDTGFTLFSSSAPRESKKAKKQASSSDKSSDKSSESGKSNTPAVEWIDAPVRSDCTFTDLGCDSWQIDVLKRVSITKPTEIQQKCIPSIIAGYDVVGRAKTGSGKTATFALPILQKLAKDPYGIFAIILTPTRELAYQIEDQFKILGKPLDISTCVIVGGMDMVKQAGLLNERPQIVIATPGRLSDLLVRGSVDFYAQYLQFLVFDEADRLFEDCFAPFINTILDYIPSAEDRQTLMFSATITEPILQGYHGLHKLLNNPKYIQVNQQDDNVVKGLEQSYLVVPQAVKETYLVYLICSLFNIQIIEPSKNAASSDSSSSSNKSDDSSITDPAASVKHKSAIIFVNTCKGATFISELLTFLNIPNVALHSKVPQQKRLTNLAKFRSSHVNILVCTDVASRGLDIPTVTWVCNYDIPRVPEDYIHRVGRTARAGKGGSALNIVTQYDVDLYKQIEEKAIGFTLDAYTNYKEEKVLEYLKKVTEAKKYVQVAMKDLGVTTTRVKTKLKLTEE